MDRGVIDQQLQALGESPRWWDERELRDLPAVLQANEQILAITRGKLGRPRWLRRSWLIVATDSRLVCLRAAGRTGWRQFEVNGNLITRVTLRIGPFRGRVLVAAGGHMYRLLAPRTDAYKLSAALSALVPVTREAPPSYRPGLMIRRVIDHVLALPAAALNPETHNAPLPAPPTDSAIDQQVESLEEQLQELRQQVDFLEQLLHKQHATSAPDRQLRPD